MAKVWVCESRTSLLCFLIRSCMHLPVTPMYTLPHSQGILNTTPSCFRVSTGSLGRTKCDLNVVSDLKTDHTTCCCRQRWRTAVDLNSGEGSLSDAYRFLEFVMLFRSIMTQNNLKTTVCHHQPHVASGRERLAISMTLLSAASLDGTNQSLLFVSSWGLPNQSTTTI